MLARFRPRDIAPGAARLRTPRTTFRRAQISNALHAVMDGSDPGGLGGGGSIPRSIPDAVVSVSLGLCAVPRSGGLPRAAPTPSCVAPSSLVALLSGRRVDDPCQLARAFLAARRLALRSGNLYGANPVSLSGGDGHVSRTRRIGHADFSHRLDNCVLGTIAKLLRPVALDSWPGRGHSQRHGRTGVGDFRAQGMRHWRILHGATLGPTPDDAGAQPKED